MARSKLTDTTEDLNNDSGSVLWSIVKGEQLEFPIILNFIENAPIVVSGSLAHPASVYTYETVVVEAANIAFQEEKPVIVQPNGQSTLLNIRIPTYRGNWDPAQAYNKEEVVAYATKYYKLLVGAARVNSTVPSSDSLWEETVLNKVYLQFPASLGSGWAVSAAVSYPVYGFFEMRVTEPQDAIFRRTWKPIRGMVELLFSPTDYVPDV